eukprot:PITA_21887
MLFGHPSVQEARLLKDLLSTFSDATGPLINRVKSQIFFFNTPMSTQNSIARILGFTIANLPSKYLGAPMIASALKHASWTDLLDKFEAKLSLWTYRSLNMASRVILIKAILQSLPLYLFSLLAAPKWVIKAIRNLQRNFLWGSSGHNRKWALLKWDKVCLPKKSGGIGIRDPELSNTVMGAKLWWRWLAHPNTRWASFWTAKYASNKPIEDRIRMSELSTGSIIWNAAIQHRHLIQRHCFWEIRDGTTAKFWDDSWQQFPKLRDLLQDLPPTQQHPQHLETVHRFWSPSNNQKCRQWKGTNQILGAEGNEGIKQALATELQKRQIIMNEGPDLLRWGYEEKGTFSTREAYNIITAEDLPSTPTEKSIWDNWQISLPHQAASKSTIPIKQEKKKIWTPPPPNLFQLNFDGASKGNPGLSGYVGVFRDHSGNPHLIYLGSKGWDTNNSAELEGLWQGLVLAQVHNFFPLVVEGDSQIIINMGKHLA